MTSKTGLMRLTVILLFIVTFTVVGWASPALYASHAPEDHFIEVHGFEAQNTTTSADSHLICFDRTSHQSASGRVFTELYLVDDESGEQRTEIGSMTMDRYFHQGNQEVVTPLEMPDNLVEGDYKYLLIVRMELADGRVTRDFAYTSETFTIDDDIDANESVKSFSC